MPSEEDTPGAKNSRHGTPPRGRSRSGTAVASGAKKMITRPAAIGQESTSPMRATISGPK